MFSLCEEIYFQKELLIESKRNHDYFKMYFTSYRNKSRSSLYEKSTYKVYIFRFYSI